MTIYLLFPRKAKKKCWKTVEKFQKNLTCFKTLYTSEERLGDIFHQLEELKIWKKFDQKLQLEHKEADLASLPPCKQALLCHAKKANLIAYMTYVEKLGTANYCNTRNRRPWVAS